MKDSFRLGRVAGITVGVHWSLLVMAGLVAAGLAEDRFSIEAPGHSAAGYVVAGVATAVGLLIGVLLHELAHAVVARRKGLRVDGITLSWMGGVTRIEGDTGRPGTELLVAGVGPLTSAAVGALLLAVRVGAESAGAGPLVVASLGWLAWINIVLAAFNLIPAAPLDGGKVLHGLVWAAGGDRWRATRIAAGVGVALGAAIVVAGLVVSERTQNLFNGLLISLVGWWLVGSARLELAGGAVQETLGGVKLRDIMRPVGEAPGWITIRAFMDQYAASRPGWVWLLQSWGGGYGGLLIGDALAAVPYPSWDLARPLDVALPLAATTGASPDEDALAALARTGGSRVILVVAGGHTLGAVLPSDVEAMVRSAGRTVPGRRPAARRVG
ncbi:MAG TPA: site-2 protease family protein [Acidimicrobiales bacterium]|nr:site-2 protease family protein [Acidimicrobiales bacterium]